MLQQKRVKKNGSRVKTKPGQNFRVYCGECPITNPGHPEETEHMTVSGHPKKIRCTKGHTTVVPR